MLPLEKRPSLKHVLYSTWPQASSKPEVGSSLEEVHPRSFLLPSETVVGEGPGAST